MKNPLRSLLLTLSLMAATLISGAALAGEAQDLVQARRAEVARMLQEKPSAERDKKVAAVMSGLFDYDAMARRSLGKHWESLNDEQRAEFTSVLRQLVQRNLEKNVQSTMKYDVQFSGEEESGADVKVKTKASNTKKSNEEPVLVDYVMHKTDAGFRVHDIVTEGSSMVGSYRNQFGKIIAKDGYEALIKKMKAKLNAR